MRWIAIFSLLLAAGLSAPTANAQTRATDQCSPMGLWQESNGSWTTKLSDPGRWQTWSGRPPVKGEPAAKGWLEVTSKHLTFNYDNSSTPGYAYTYSFQDKCDVMRITLVGNAQQPSPSGVSYQLLRVKQ